MTGEAFLSRPHCSDSLRSSVCINDFDVLRTSITLYKPSPLWVLVIVRFVDGSERWGTIKNVRYAKKEVKCDGEFRYAMGFSGWFINNDKHTLFL